MVVGGAFAQDAGGGEYPARLFEQNPRPDLGVPLGDVCRRILQRLGCRTRKDETVLDRFADCEVRVDPMPLDSALDMIAEALGCTDRQSGSGIEAELRFEQREREAELCFLLDLHPCDGNSQNLRAWRPGGAAERICESLAGAILSGFGWKLEADTNTPPPSCTIVIPLRSTSG